MNKKDKTFFHIDGDAFFATCEQATSPALRGKPIIVGYERGAATAMSYEAKALGVRRGASLKEIQQSFPQVIPVSSDYKKYALFSSRFKTLIERHYTYKIDKTSVDECYVDMTGLDISLGKSFILLAHEMKELLYEKLGVTFSIGIGPTKTLAKIGSGMNKPNGITEMNTKYRNRKIRNKCIESVPGIGSRMSMRMRDQGIFTVKQFMERDCHTIPGLARPYKDLWHELHGISVSRLALAPEPPKSISKIHAFNTPTNDTGFLLAEISRHCEVIGAKLRRNNRVLFKIGCGLKTFERMYRSREIRLEQGIITSESLFKHVETLFWEVYDPKIKYRATYVVIYGLRADSKQEQLFFDSEKDLRSLNRTVDSINERFGKAMITRASSQKNSRDMKVMNATPLLYSRDMNKVLTLPYLGRCC